MTRILSIISLLGLLLAPPVFADRPARGERMTPQAAGAQAFAEGRRKELAGDLRGAFMSYSTAIEADPENAEAQIAYGRMIEPQNPPLAFFHYQIALRILMDQAEEAKVPLLPRFRKFLVDKFVTYALPVQDPPVSIRLLQQALVLEPQDPRIHAQLSVAHFMNKDYERSVGEGRLAWSLGLEDAQLRLNVGLGFLQAGETNAAANELAAALEIDQFDVLPVLAMLEPSDPRQQIDWVPFPRGLGRARFDEIVRNSTMGRIGEAKRLLDAGDSVGALAKVREAAAARTGHSNVRVYEGDIARATGDNPGAARAYQDALRRDTQSILVRIRLADLAVEMGDAREAAVHYEAILSREDVAQAGLSEVVANCAKALAATERLTRGIRYIDDWLSRFSPSRSGVGGAEPREAFLLRLEKARLLAAANSAVAAEAAYRELASAHPLEGEAYAAAANYLRAHGKNREATSLVNDGLVRLQAAVEAEPRNAKSYVEYAALLASKGDTPGAVRVLLDGARNTNVPREFVNALHRIDELDAAEEGARIWVERAQNSADKVEATVFWGFLAAEANKNVSEARQALEALSDGAVPDVALRRVRGYLEFRLGHYREALSDLTNTLEERLGAERGLYERLVGLSYAEIGGVIDTRRAIDHLEKAMEADPARNSDLAARIQTLRGE